MAVAKPHLPSLRFAAVFGQQTEALDWACERATGEWGQVLLQSADIEFDMTSFYEKSMGDGLKKRLIAFQPLIDPMELVQSKVDSNQWELDYKTQGHRQPGADRPVNIDPGYLTEAKVVLMTTKDRDHRLYMGSGIYAEVTLFYHCLLYTSPSPRDRTRSRMPSSA